MTSKPSATSIIVLRTRIFLNNEICEDLPKKSLNIFPPFILDGI